MNTLTIDRSRMCFLDGDAPWMQRGCLVWPAFGVLMNDGERAFRDILVDRRGCGANTVALGGMWSRYPNLHPSIPGYWESLTPACRIAREEGMRLQWVVLASTSNQINGHPVEWVGMPPGVWWPGMPDLAAQKAHWERFLVHQGAEPNVTFLVCNQPGHRDQRPPTAEQTTEFVKPAGFPQLLCARSNPLETQNPPLPPLDFSCYCSSRKEVQGLAELGASMWYVVWGWVDKKEWPGTGQVSVLFEPPRVDEGGYWADPGKWRQMGRSLCMQGTGGGNFYSTQDRFAQPLTGVTRACAVEFLGNIPSP